MKKLALAFLFIASFMTTLAEAMTNFDDIYPAAIQWLIGTEVFEGDRYGEFAGDLVALISDGSAWKIHPTQRDDYLTWNVDDVVHVRVRTDFYWFKREHKFELCNDTNGQALKAMLVNHIDVPIPLTVIDSETYISGYQLASNSTDSYEYDWESEQYQPKTTWETVSLPVWRKKITLSDGSEWIIKKHFHAFNLGSQVYVGAQGSPDKWYDFVLISGTEREAEWTFARPPKVD